MTKEMNQAINFESSLTELESIIEKIGSGQLSLEDALQYFEQGIALARQCQKNLKEAEQTVQVLITQNGKAQMTPFNEEE